MMKYIALCLLPFFMACSNNTKQECNTEKPDEFIAIKEMLTNQQACWNKGDIDGFMRGYWKSEKLIFTSAIHKPTYGWENTLERYKNSYPTKESMGEFNFEILDLKLVTNTTATLKGKWELIRKDDHPHGIFWLDIKKFEKGWRITKDSTISL